MYPTPLLADPALRPPLRASHQRRERVRPAEGRPFPWARLLAALLVAVAAGGLGFLRAWPPLATVMSGSMAPTIDTGDMVILQRLGRPARQGDVVAIQVPETARARYGYPPVVIHRIIAIGADGRVTTKGDARKEHDPFSVPASALKTRVIGRVPAAGRAMAFLSSGPGLLWLLSGAGLFLALPLVERRREAHRQEEAAAEALRAQIAALSENFAALQSRPALTAELAERLERLPDLVEESVSAFAALRLPPSGDGPCAGAAALEPTDVAKAASDDPAPAGEVAEMSAAASPPAGPPTSGGVDAMTVVVAPPLRTAVAPAAPMNLVDLVMGYVPELAPAVPAPCRVPIGPAAFAAAALEHPAYALVRTAAPAPPTPAGAWDAPPPGVGAPGSTWDAPPRFRRTGGLVAASAFATA